MKANLLNQLPGSTRHPPGLERTILRMIPMVLCFGTLVPMLVAFTYPWFAPFTAPDDLAANQIGVNILMISIVATLWVMILTLAIGCATIWVMKGPAYVADAYEINDSDYPVPGVRKAGQPSVRA